MGDPGSHVAVQSGGPVHQWRRRQTRATQVLPLIRGKPPGAPGGDVRHQAFFVETAEAADHLTPERGTLALMLGYRARVSPVRDKGERVGGFVETCPGLAGSVSQVH